MNKGRTLPAEKLLGFALEPRVLLAVEVEADFAPVQLLIVAGKPQVVDAAGPVGIENDVLALFIDVEL